MGRAEVTLEGAAGFVGLLHDLFLLDSSFEGTLEADFDGDVLPSVVTYIRIRGQIQDANPITRRLVPQP